MALTKTPIELSSTPGIVDNSNATAITIDASENVGIGVSPLTLSGNAAPGLTVSSNGPFILLQDANNADKVTYISNNTGDLQFGIVGDDGATGKTEHMRIASDGSISIPNQDAINEISFTGTEFTNIVSATTSGFELGTTGAGYLRFLTNNTERMRIDGSTGNVRIGGTSNISNPYSQMPNFTDVNLDGTWGGVISFKLGGVTKGWVGQRSSGNADMVIGATAGQELLFYENNVEAMRISSGKLMVGKTTNVYSGALEVQQALGGAVSTAISCTHASQPYGLLLHFTAASPDNHTNYFITGSDSTTNRFFVYSDGDVWTSDSGTLTSDERLKTNVQDATPKLDDLLALRVRNFEWIPEYHPNKVGEKKIGFIAQEFEQTFPALVSENTFELNGEEVTRKSVRMGALIPILVKGMQEQQATIESQAAAITDLTTRLTALENN